MIKKACLIALFVCFSYGCASHFNDSQQLQQHAVISATSSNWWRMLINPKLKWVQIRRVDGLKVKQRFGPIYLEPGEHLIEIGVEGDFNIQKINVKAGDVWHFSFMPADTLREQGRLYRVQSGRS